MELSFKVCLVGPTKSGKTRFTNRMRGTVSNEIYPSTLGFEARPIRKDGLIINLWDTGSKLAGVEAEKWYMSECKGILRFHNEDDDPLPFDIPNDVPLINVPHGEEGDEQLERLIQVMLGA